MKILVTGCNGQLGMHFKSISINYAKIVWVFKNKNQFSLQKLEEIESNLYEISPDVIINCGAYTNVEKAEHEKKVSNIINNYAVSVIANWSHKNNVKLFHFSSDYVYSGKIETPLKEFQTSVPINYYGKTKFWGEKGCLDKNPDSIIIRTSANFSMYGKNFLKTIFKKMTNQKIINVVNDQFFSPTYSGDISELVMSILNHQVWKPGIYNYSNLGELTWYDFAVEINSICNFNTIINPISYSEYNSNIKRPKYTLLNKEKIKKTFNITIPHYKFGLEKCIKTLIDEK